MAGITEDTLISEFVAESRDHLTSLEPDLLEMEQEGANVSSEVVNRAFRAIHSIKGSSSVLGFDSLMKLTHIMENVLMQIRNKKMVPNSNTIDALLQSADKVSFMIDDVHSSNQVNYDVEIERLNDILNNNAQSDQQTENFSTAISKTIDSTKEEATQKKQAFSSESQDQGIKPEILSDNKKSDDQQSDDNDTDDQQIDTDQLQAEIQETSIDTDDVIAISHKQKDSFQTDDSKSYTADISLNDNGLVTFDINGSDHFVCQIQPDKIVNVYDEAKSFYAIWIYGTTDLVNKDRGPDEFLNDMISLGNYLFSDFADENQPDRLIFHMIISSILEKELLESAIDIPAGQIYEFSKEIIEKLIKDINESPKIIRQPSDSSSKKDTKEKKEVKQKKETQTSDEKTSVSTHTSKAPPTDITSETSQASIVASKSDVEKSPGHTRVSPLKSGTGLRLEASAQDMAIFEIDNSKIESLLAKKKKLFVVWIHSKKDLEDKDCDIKELLNDIKSLGECITHDFDRLITEPETQYYHMLVSSIMEKDLLSNGLDFPKNQIVNFSIDDLIQALSGKSGSKSIITKQQTSKVSEQFPQKTDFKAMRKTEPQAKTSVVTTRKSTQSSHVSETIRVAVDLIDRLMNLAGELVLGRNQLRQEIEEKVVDNPRLINVMQNVNLVTSEIQENIMRMRMQPLSSIFNKFPRVVRDIARQLYKKAEIVIDGGEVELDKSILENLSDPLTHIIRNSLDHGIEPPEVRMKNNKSETGLIHLTAIHEGSQVIITVSDNGRGIDAEALSEKAINTNLVTQEQVSRMSVKQKINLIFLPGFSTAKTVSDISGRGVGMDVVKTNIEKLGGHVDLDSTIGKGTIVIIRLPLTLSIIPSLIVGSCNHIFAIPQINVQELVNIKASEVAKRLEKVGDATVLRLRERLLPMVWLNEVLGLGDEIEPEKSESIKEKTPSMDLLPAGDNANRFLEVTQLDSLEKNVNIVVLRVGTNSFGLAVNQLFDNEEIVVKPLSRHIKDCKCFSGSTIMGDGRVAMILDTAGIADFAFLRFAEISAEERRRREQEERDKKAASKRKPILLFNNALDEYFGLPLSNISRLELISRDNIQLVGQREFINYNGKGLPLIRLENFLAVNPLPELDELYLIIPKTNGPVAGIMVSRIINILDIQEDIARDAYTPKGFLGSGFIEGYLTFFLDPEAVLSFLEEEGI